MKGTIFLLLVVTTAVSAGCDNKKKLLREAERCITDSNYKKGIIICNEILSLDSTVAEAYGKRGYCYEMLGNYKNAGTNYSQGIHFDKTGWKPYMFRASLFCKQEHCEYSISDYNIALANAPNDSIKGIVLTNRGMTYGKLRQFDKAIEDTRQALKYDSNNVYALSNIGQALSESGKTQESIEWFEKAIKVNPDFEGGIANLAFAYSLVGEHQKAIDMNTKIILKNPKRAYAYNNRGYSKMQLNDFEGAMKDINRSIEINSRNSYAFRNRGLLYLKLKKTDEACADFHTALKMDFTQQYGPEVEELVKKNCPK